MSSQQVIVKAYYNDLVENQPEIRRFSLDVSTNTNVYQTLETTIAQLNTNYQQGQFTLQYIDEDNDRITFSSESELRSALNNVASGGLIKIYVKPKTTKTTNDQQANETIHPGVTCDGCQGPVIGNRYKCTVCPDYDLCQACSDKKIHPDHNMIKITHPWQRFFGGHRRCGRGPFGGRPCGGPGRFWRRFMHQQAGGDFHIPVPGDITNFLSQYKGKELAELIEAHLPEYLRTEKINEMINQFKTGEQADKPIEHSILLEYVGKFLQEVLSPFGIDCDYFVDKNEQQQQQKPTETKENQEQPTATNSTSTEPKSTAPPTSETASASASASAAPNAPSFGNLLDQLQTMFTPMFQQAATAATTAPNTVDQQAEEEKKIAECVERMTAMGFVDSNGVLTELIKSKKGDLNQVLDALNPRNYQN